MVGRTISHYQILEKIGDGGRGVEETAAVLGISAESVMRDWRLARGWLARELSRKEPHGSGQMATD
jgi:hypothetical protein